jgi:hypothetical protein
MVAGGGPANPVEVSCIQVPGCALLGVSVITIGPAWAGGTIIEMETNNAEMSSSTSNRELEL